MTGDPPESPTSFGTGLRRCLCSISQALDRAAADCGILNTRDQHLSLNFEVPQVQHLHRRRSYARGSIPRISEQHPWRQIC